MALHGRQVRRREPTFRQPGSIAGGPPHEAIPVSEFGFGAVSIRVLMSASGQKQTSGRASFMSALPPIADIQRSSEALAD